MKYYTCANTSAGFCDFTKDNIFDVKNTVMLKSTNQFITDKILRRIISLIPDLWDEIITPGTGNLVSGIIANNRNFAVVTSVEDADVTVNADSFFGIQNHCEKIMPSAMERAYATAKSIHDDWEKIYIQNMDFPRLDSYCENIISILSEGESKSGTGKVYKRFFGTVTPEGSINYIDEITHGISKRYFIKGRPGTGKSTFLKKLTAKLIKKGFDVEQYYCSFDPGSLDMVISRELSFCVFDSTAPHEKFPEKEWDVILDFYEESGLKGIDEKYENELALIKNAYTAKIKEGNEALGNAMKNDSKVKMGELERINEKDILELAKRICGHMGM